MNKEFPQTKIQEEIYKFWSVRGYSKVTAVLGNLNVSFHREISKYEELGLSYQYLEQFYIQAQKDLFTQEEIQVMRDMIREKVKKMRDSIPGITLSCRKD